jgi:hypothetical protein
MSGSCIWAPVSLELGGSKWRAEPALPARSPFVPRA